MFQFSDFHSRWTLISFFHMLLNAFEVFLDGKISLLVLLLYLLFGFVKLNLFDSLLHAFWNAKSQYCCEACQAYTTMEMFALTSQL